jgi:hypothetical protein
VPTPGGAITNNANLAVTECSFSGNTAHDGTSGKTSGDNGGAIHNNGVLSVSRCTFDNNTANGGGAINNTGALGVVLSTFTKNAVAFHGNGGGGAILNRGSSMNLISCTIADNTADGFGGGTYNDFQSGGTPRPTQITSSVIANNHAPTSADVFGAYTSNGFNLIGVSDSGNGFTKPSDQSGTTAAPLDPKLDALAYNGGLTLTMALQPASPAIDQGNNDSSITADQRGFERRVNIPHNTNAGDGSDVGAYELNLALPAVATTLATNVTQQTATLNGDVNPKGSQTSAYFEYGLDTSYGSSTAVQNAGSGTSLIKLTADVSGLTPDATYHFRIVATNFGGRSDGADQTFTTSPKPNASAPSVATGLATNLTMEAATLNGQTNPNGSQTNAHFEYGPTTAYGTVTPVQDAGSGTSVADLTASISGLTANTTYHFRIVATNVGGTTTGVDQTFETLGAPTPTPTATATATPTTLANISTRLRVQTGDNVLIGGFIVTGTQPKKVIVRAIGPSLAVAGHLEDPTLDLYNSSGELITSNDNWVNAANKQEIIDSTVPPANDLEAAILVTLPANNAGYTAIVRGSNGGTGIGLVEAYDLDRSVDSKLANISTRGFVQTGDDVMIGGLIIVGNDPLKVIIRALGPSLAVADHLRDPSLELHDGNGALLTSNDNWRVSQESEIEGSTIPPQNDLESAIVATLVPANYTAIVRGVGGATGVALVEVYNLQ